jgi:hypothetical protein
MGPGREWRKVNARLLMIGVAMSGEIFQLFVV